MSSSSLPPLHLDFARGRVREVLCACTLMITITAPMFATAVQGWGIVALTGIASTVVAAYVHWRTGWLGHAYRVNTAVWDGEGQWWLTLPGCAQMRAELCPESVALRAGAWLVFKTERRGRIFVLVPAYDFPDLYRRLLVRLRIRGLNSSSDTAHVYAHLPSSNANFRQARGSIRALKELPWPRTTRDEIRRP